MTVAVSDEQLAGAAELIRAGRLVGFPTETVYGLGGDATNPRAIAEIFAAKGRPRFDPIIVHLADAGGLAPLVTSVPPAAVALADRFWPGPLTLVLPKSPTIPDICTAGLPNVAIRVPAHPLAQRLITEAGCPLAAPSANRFGGLSPTTAEHVREQLGSQVALVLDGGPCQVGVESSVVDLTGEQPVLLRPGGVGLEDLESVVGPLAVGTRHESAGSAAPGPGMLPRHYAPRTPLSVVTQLDQRPPGRLGLLALVAPETTDGFDSVEVLSPTADLLEAAAGFFAALHRLDAAGLDRILALPFPEAGLGRALNDRLRRAEAGGAGILSSE